MRPVGLLPWVLAAALVPASARSASLVFDRLDTPDVVQAGDSVSFSFALQFGPDEILLATQAEITAPHLGEFRFAKARSPWDLSADFRLRGENPMWVYAENTYGEEDAPGVTWDEVGGLAPLGSFSAVATYNGEIELILSDWVLSLLGGPAVPLAPEWAHIRTGVTVVGGAELPPPPAPPVAPPPAPAPPAPPSPSLETPGAVPGYRIPGVELQACGRRCVRPANRFVLEQMVIQGPMVPVTIYPGEVILAADAPEPRTSLLAGLAALLLGLRRARG